MHLTHLKYIFEACIVSITTLSHFPVGPQAREHDSASSPQTSSEPGVAVRVRVDVKDASKATQNVNEHSRNVR